VTHSYLPVFFVRTSVNRITETIFIKCAAAYVRKINCLKFLSPILKYSVKAVF